MVMPPRSGLVLFALSLAACGGSEFQGASGTEAGTGGSGAGNVGGATGASGATAGGSGGATGKGGTGGGSGKGGSGTGGGSGKGGSGATGGSGAGAGGAATAGHGGAANGGHGTAGDGTAGNGTVGGSGGSGTAGGGTAGGGTAGGGTGGNATAAGGAAGNGTAGTGAAGAPTCNEGDSTCVTESSYSECVNGATVTKTCSAGFSCDQDATSPALRCRQPLEACADPSAFFCAGQQLQQCISRFAFGFVAQCDSAQLCDLHVGATCAVCAAKGEVTCDGSTLLECEITSQTVLQVCTIGTKCNASAKGCLLTACSAGETRCNAGNIETCDMSLMSWNVTTPCANGCGGTPPACFNCMPATAECTVDGRSVCSADGVGFQPAPCDPATPICVGAGTCVECQATPDCANPEPCVVLAGCNANTCVYVPKDCGPKSMCCDNGSCSDSGHLCE